MEAITKLLNNRINRILRTEDTILRTEGCPPEKVKTQIFPMGQDNNVLGIYIQSEYKIPLFGYYRIVQVARDIFTNDNLIQIETGHNFPETELEEADPEKYPYMILIECKL